jgi:Domain of unknown function (DUF932)
MQIYSAANQWATRPEDERFTSLEEMYNAAKAAREMSVEKERKFSDLRVEAQGDDMSLVGKAGVPAKIAHYAFGQLANRIGAPAAYLRSLPATLAAQNLNFGLKEKVTGLASLLFHKLASGVGVLRAVTSDSYERVWNHEVIARLIDLSQRERLQAGRTTMGGDSNPDGLDLNGKASRALYASDHDMFAFLMGEQRIVDPVGQGMFRGIIVANSEVGDRSLMIQSFLFREVCWNHIIWDASNVIEVKLRHVGEIRSRWMTAQAQIRQYLNSSTSIEQAKFKQLRAQIAGTKDEVLDTLFGKRALGLSRKALEASFEAVVPAEDGDPKSVWGFAQGVTRYSQTQPYADERFALDRAAGKLIDLDF